MPTIAFRTQDTKANWARKLNALLTQTPHKAFREVPQTSEQWQIQLNAAVRALITAGYVFPTPILFRLADTRQKTAWKLNRMSEAVEAGIPASGP